tara:strand:+ start:162 stop:1331 length:1170 start_codon:yes stop_codon:yes gene_type:complete
MASNAKNLAELLNTDSTVAVGDIADGSVTTAKLADNAVTSAKALNLGRRNLVINGAMTIAQRGTQTDQTSAYTACDRWNFAENGSVVVTTSQDTDVPSGQGFANSLKIDVTTASGTPSSGNYALVRTKFEGQDLQHLLYGTSNAKSLTLSFWVKSPKTGTHIVQLKHNDAIYFNSITYTVNSANTWEHKSVTFVGYQTTAFDDDNNNSLQVYWWLMKYNEGTLTENTWHNTAANQASGQVNTMDNTSNNFYLTGVQLEVGDTATDFEHRSFAEELQLCQRYCEIVPQGHQMVGRIESSSNNWGKGQFTFKTTKRSGASMTVSHSDTSSPLMSVDWTSTNFTSAFSNLSKGQETTSGIVFRLTDSSFNSNDGGATHISPSGGYLIIEDEL